MEACQRWAQVGMIRVIIWGRERSNLDVARICILVLLYRYRKRMNLQVME